MYQCENNTTDWINVDPNQNYQNLTVMLFLGERATSIGGELHKESLPPPKQRRHVKAAARDTGQVSKATKLIRSTETSRLNKTSVTQVNVWQIVLKIRAKTIYSLKST